MLHPFLIPSLLNASLATSSPNPHTTAPTSFVYCFTQQPPQGPQLLPTTYLPCKEALKGIPLGDAGLKPVSFGRSEESGFQVPHKWTKGDCAVEIDVTGESVTETTTFAKLLIVAFEVAVECVIRGEHLGGRALIGETEGLNLWIYGSEGGSEA